MASYGVIRLNPDHTWSRKAVFHTLSTTYSTMGGRSCE